VLITQNFERSFFFLICALEYLEIIKKLMYYKVDPNINSNEIGHLDNVKYLLIRS
jgi:hypothetical protein